MKEDFLEKKLSERKMQNAFRSLKLPGNKIDFYSNDYLGIIKNDLLNNGLAAGFKQGSGGSRLLGGNNPLIEEAEKAIAEFHGAEAGLIFNSGYDANVGLLSCVPQKGDTILYDRLSHASLRDGIRLSFAESFSFLHNDVQDLDKKLKEAKGNVFIVTESVFSMDGDIPPLPEIISICQTYSAHLIVDEAHATGVVGTGGEGLVQHLNVQKECFARIHTFGKACGVHGAIVLGSDTLKNYLVNFARTFIYTTALPQISVAAILASYKIFPSLSKERAHLKILSNLFQQSAINHQPPALYVQPSITPIQAVIIPGNAAAKAMAEKLQDNNLDVRAIIYPSVPKGTERLRIVLHAFNTEKEINKLLDILFS